MSTWTVDDDIAQLPPEERALVKAMVAYAGAFFRGAPAHELQPLRHVWRYELKRRWPEREPPDERAGSLPAGVIALR